MQWRGGWRVLHKRGDETVGRVSAPRQSSPSSRRHWPWSSHIRSCYRYQCSATTATRNQVPPTHSPGMLTAPWEKQLSCSFLLRVSYNSICLFWSQPSACLVSTNSCLWVSDYSFCLFRTWRPGALSFLAHLDVMVSLIAHPYDSSSI